MRRSLACGMLVAGLTALAAPASAAPPTPVDDYALEVDAGGACPFPVTIVLNGKGKAIDVGGMRQIVTSPGLTAVVTNRDTGRQVAYVVTGTFHHETLEGGNVVTIATGRNLLLDPQAGFVLTTGRYTYTMAADGVTNVEPLRRLGGPEPVDVCADVA
ncbi:MAG TPA: hypothetical protein VFP34_13000 [Microlunatus sp.]|nr:hypothetical protein [Microlunatus sp.]